MLLAWPTDAYLLISQPQSSSTARASTRGDGGPEIRADYRALRVPSLRGVAANVRQNQPRLSQKLDVRRAQAAHRRVQPAPARSARGPWRRRPLQQHLVPTPAISAGSRIRRGRRWCCCALSSAHALCERTRLKTRRTAGGIRWPASSLGHFDRAQGDRRCAAILTRSGVFRRLAPPRRRDGAVGARAARHNVRAAAGGGPRRRARARAGLLAAGGRRHVRGGEDVRRGGTFISAPTSAAAALNRARPLAAPPPPPPRGAAAAASAAAQSPPPPPPARRRRHRRAGGASSLRWRDLRSSSAWRKFGRASSRS